MTINTVALTEIVENSGLSYKKNAVSWIFTCPRCSKKDKLYLRKRDGRFVCWYCSTVEGYQGKPEIALADLTGMPIREIRYRLYGEGLKHSAEGALKLNIKDFFGPNDEVPDDLEPLEPLLFPLDFYPIDHEHSAKGLAYLESRGINLELAKQYDIHYHPKERRVIFPVFVGDDLIGWQARTIDPTERINYQTGEEYKVLKIRTSKGLPRDRCLMFQNRLEGSDHVVLCEGPVDAIKAHLCGGNVASMGKSVSRGQLEIIRKSGVKKVYLALDPDAQAEVTRLCKEFGDLEVYQMLAPAPYKDLGEMPLELVREIFDNAPRVRASRSFIRLTQPTLR